MAVWVKAIHRALAAWFGEEERHMTKTREPQQTVAACEQTLKQLEAKRAKLVERGAELPELRKGAAYLAHVEQNAKARTALDRINAEVAIYDSELASLDDAIAAAKNKVLIAQAFEADAADRQRAARALELLGAFREAGSELDDAFRAIAEKGKLLGGLLGQLHACGVRSPTAEQLDVLGFAAVQTALMATPWHQRFRYLGPSQRRSFGPLFDQWAATAEARLRAQLREGNDDVAAA
jgi:hypothetical protein